MQTDALLRDARALIEGEILAMHDYDGTYKDHAASECSMLKSLCLLYDVPYEGPCGYAAPRAFLTWPGRAPLKQALENAIAQAFAGREAELAEHVRTLRRQNQMRLEAYFRELCEVI